MARGLVNINQKRLDNVMGGINQYAELERQRNITNRNVEAQQKAADTTTMGVGAGMGASKGMNTLRTLAEGAETADKALKTAQAYKANLVGTGAASAQQIAAADAAIATATTTAAEAGAAASAAGAGAGGSTLAAIGTVATPLLIGAAIAYGITKIFK